MEIRTAYNESPTFTKVSASLLDDRESSSMDLVLPSACACCRRYDAGHAGRHDAPDDDGRQGSRGGDLQNGVVPGSRLGLEIEVSTCGSVYDTWGRFE